MKPIATNKKLSLLNKYMIEFIDEWPKPIKPFDSWVDSYLDKQQHLGKKKEQAQFKAQCRYCRIKFDEDIEKTKDHVIPKSKFGYDVKENRVFACYECNQWKGSMTLDEWHDVLKKVLKKDRVKLPYNNAMIGLMMGNIKQQLSQMKQVKNKISTYKN